MMDRDKLIWAAGFFDGEGCVSIRRQKRPARENSVRDVYWTYTIDSAVSQKNPEPLEVFKALFGGHLYSYESYGVTYWRWCIAGKHTYRMLVLLLPYLIVKKGIAELAIRFQEKQNQWRKLYQHPGSWYPDHVLQEREMFYQQGRVLNARNRANHKAPKYAGPQMSERETVN